MNEIDNSKSNSSADNLNEISAGADLGGARKIELKDSIQRRDWWHRILAIYGRYPCCAFLLLLPSNQEALQYLKEYNRELHIISGKSCLVIALSDKEGFCTEIDEQLWATGIDKYVADGQSVTLGQYFDIPVTNFPCLVIFHDIRNFDHVTVNLKNLSTEDIAVTMNEVFSVISKASNNKLDILKALTSERRNKAFLKMGRTLISDMKSLVGKSYEIALNAYIMASTPH